MNSYKASALLCAALLAGGLLSGCSEDDGVSGLTPAREIVGTWKTTFPVKHYIKTDFCSVSLQDVATQDRMVTVVITEAGEATVDIQWTYVGTNFAATSSQCNPTGYVPDVSPMFLKGTISGDKLTVAESSGRTVGLFDFLGDMMEGTWDDQWCLAYCQEVYTSSKALKLMLQH